MTSSKKVKLKYRKINSSKVILCEGSDECDLLTMLRQERGLTESDVEIEEVGGRDKFELEWSDIRAQSGGRGIRLLTLVFDSEDDPAGAQKWAQEFAQKHQSETLKITYFQLPSATQIGSIETLIRSSISQNSIGFACATQWQDCVQSKSETKFDRQAKMDKAWLQVWLTHRTKSTASRIGYAISKNDDLRKELDACLAPLKGILDAVVQATVD